MIILRRIFGFTFNNDILHVLVRLHITVDLCEFVSMISHYDIKKTLPKALNEVTFMRAHVHYFI